MKQDLIKEIRNGSRNSRFLIILAGFFFFALSTPVMTKIILPQILKSQMPGLPEEVMKTMFDMSQIGSLQSYMGDVFEIGSLIVAFTLCGLLAQEIRDHVLVLPLCAGKRYSSIVLAKLIVFGLTLLLIPTIALLASYVYSGLLFTFEVGVLPVLVGGLLQGLFMVFLLSCLLLLGAWMKKPVAAGILSLLGVYGIHFIGGLFRIHEYLPSGLLVEAQKLSETPPLSLLWTVLITLALIAGMTSLTVMQLRHLEWQARAN